ncbi:MAG: hypothetical protein EZS28_032771 [Streblomastix strix]|uniref:C2 domain-containing protein n=1 Tax=Streblomastix strix TaxID=222440 RepID=A0A5J4UNR2_9EUKA|nr:MAG: hypothetical protein EZS28_032771 [Streblomastix strix]
MAELSRRPNPWKAKEAAESKGQQIQMRSKSQESQQKERFYIKEGDMEEEEYDEDDEQQQYDEDDEEEEYDEEQDDDEYEDDDYNILDISAENQVYYKQQIRDKIWGDAFDRIKQRLEAYDNTTRHTNNVGALITIINAHNIIPIDSNGKADPFVKVIAGGKEMQTKHAKDTLNAEYNERFEFDIKKGDWISDDIIIELWDHDSLSDNYKIGIVKVPV